MLTTQIQLPDELAAYIGQSATRARISETEVILRALENYRRAEVDERRERMRRARTVFDRHIADVDDVVANHDEYFAEAICSFHGMPYEKTAE